MKAYDTLVLLLLLLFSKTMSIYRYITVRCILCSPGCNRHHRHVDLNEQERMSDRVGGRTIKSPIRFYPHKIETLCQTKVLIKFLILFQIKSLGDLIMHNYSELRGNICNIARSQTLLFFLTFRR